MARGLVDRPPRAFERETRDRGAGRRDPRRGLRPRGGRAGRAKVERSTPRSGRSGLRARASRRMPPSERRVVGRMDERAPRCGDRRRPPGLLGRLGCADSHRAKMTMARGAPKCTRASQLIPLCPKQREFNTARSTTFEHQGAPPLLRTRPGVIDAPRRSRTPRAARSTAREPEVSASTRLPAESKSRST